MNLVWLLSFSPMMQAIVIPNKKGVPNWHSLSKQKNLAIRELSLQRPSSLPIEEL